MIKQLTNDIDRAKSEELRKQSAWQLEQSKEKKRVKQIERCILKAPGDGVIVYANDPNRIRGGVQIEEGANVRERQLIFRVVDPNGPMRINTKVHEAIVDRLKLGMRARIKIDAFPNLDMTGSVISVAPMADVLSRNLEIKVYTTFVGVENRPPGLRPGLTARVEILVSELDNVLSVPVASVVPLTAVAPSDERYQVAVKTPEGAIEWRDVTLGMNNGADRRRSRPVYTSRRARGPSTRSIT